MVTRTQIAADVRKSGSGERSATPMRSTRRERESTEATGVARGLGSPSTALPSSVAATMSSLFARDFSGLRVHTDDAAGAAAAALDARAFTVGRHIVFGSGQYAPTTPRGRSLIAHELAHTAQQPASENPDKRLEASPADGPHERQATQWAARARAAGTPRGADARPIGGGSMHRIPVLATGRQMVQRQSVFTTAMQTDRRARPTTPADQFAVAEAAGRSAGSQYGEVMASTADAEKTLHIKELEARIAKGGYDPEKIRPIVESVAKVRAAMSAEVEDALARFPHYREPDLQQAAKSAFEKAAEDSYASSMAKIMARKILLDALGMAIAGLVTKLAEAGVKAVVQEAGAVARGANAAPRPPRAPTYERKAGAHHPEPEPYGGLLPPKPGAQAANRGFQNELEVAKITGGKLARDATKISEGGNVADVALGFKQPSGQGGKVAIDVLGPNNELIVVGGPAKGGDLGKLVSRLTDLKRAAEQRNVRAIAYFTEDTPADVLDKARRTLGAENVRLFKRPPYQQP